MHTAQSLSSTQHNRIHQRSSNFFVWGSHKLLHNSSRAGHLT